jgi:hypothetical protein
MGNLIYKDRKETVSQTAVFDIHKHLNDGFVVTVITKKTNNSYMITKTVYNGDDYYFINYRDDSHEIYERNVFTSFIEKKQKYIKYILKTKHNEQRNIDSLIKNYIQSKTK